MKKSTNIIFWISTGLFALSMGFSGVQGVLVSEGSVSLITDQLGYPVYVIAFLGVAKILGAVAILIPGYPRIKEWAYAGLFFDLIGATYSSVAVNGPDPGILGMGVFFLFGILSYVYYRKRTDASTATVFQGSAT
jgi:hypothetical protein